MFPILLRRCCFVTNSVPAEKEEDQINHFDALETEAAQSTKSRFFFCLVLCIINHAYQWSSNVCFSLKKVVKQTGVHDMSRPASQAKLV